MQAARASRYQLLCAQEEIEEVIKGLQVNLTHAEGHVKQVEGWIKNKLKDTKGELEVVKKTLHNIQSWPVKFYCTGEGYL